MGNANRRSELITIKASDFTPTAYLGVLEKILRVILERLEDDS